MEKDFNDYGMPPPGMNMDINSDLYRDSMFNPIVQYEQAYCYYKFLCMQMDYKIKCKEYEKMSNNQNSNNDRRDRRIE